MPAGCLCHLPNDQREKNGKTLSRRMRSVYKDGNAIGCIESLKPYRKISKQFYSELKQYLGDLLTDQWITNTRILLL